MSSSIAQAQTNYQANVSLWLHCNLKCPYCYGNPSPPPQHWPPEIGPQLDHLVDFLNQTGRWTLTMSGGEVTIYPGFAELCATLGRAGHRVEFFTNGVVPLADVFDEASIKAVSRVAFSYQLGAEKVARYEDNFIANIEFLRERNIAVDVNYLLYPDRRDEPQAVKERFLGEDVDFRFLVFQGEYRQKQYPFAHTTAEQKDFARYGDLRAAFLMAHGYHQPTFKRCRAGHETFYISLRTGGVYTCEQLQQEKLADFSRADGPVDFRRHVASEPIICPAKRCSCRLTVDQETFLAEHDEWDMSLYGQWEEISLPSPRAIAHWENVERDFAAEVAGRLSGRHVFLWGGGVHTLNLLRLLASRGFPMERVRGIIDSNSLKQGQEIQGYPIISQAQFVAQNAGECTDILISSRAFEVEISAVIADSFGDRYNVIRLYDGTMENRFEVLANDAEQQGSAPVSL